MRHSNILRCFAALSMTLLAGCASSTSPTSAPKAATGHPEPELELVQVSSVADAARNITGAMPVQFTLSIRNTTSVPLKLKHIEIQSITSGAYSLDPVSRTYDQQIEPGASQNFDIWGSANASGTITGANGPVTIRAIAQFESSLGSFQTVAIKQVRADGLR